ncbi:MAG: hydrogenase maturation nickel metallochaperone HypA [Negativicutes bacterium]|nr:hydrogenase maturation nickel metallochaperone HypA [Negativicutes bacterium]
MHEYYVTEEIIRIACETAKQHQSPVINRITVVVGELTGIVSESVEFYFDVLARDTAAEGAILHIVPQPVSRLCRHCQSEFHGANAWVCPECGEPGELIKNGREFYVESVDLPD